MRRRGGGKSRFSIVRVAWAFCLLACCGFVASTIWLGRQNRAWWSSVESARWQNAQWSSAAEREARAIIGDVEGLTRQQVVERLAARLGPDDPYPQPPASVAFAYYVPLPQPPREYPVTWSVRKRNWEVIVPIYDGRADGLAVDTLKATFYGHRRPGNIGMVPMYTLLGGNIVMIVAAGITACLWWLRRSYRWAIHAWLMAAVLSAVAVLTEDWTLSAGDDYRPFALRGTGWGVVPWEGSALGLVVGLLALRLRPRRPLPGICHACRYDLTGNVSGVCPECGTEVIAPLPPPATSGAVVATR
jgi:hypothetical protein